MVSIIRYANFRLRLPNVQWQVFHAFSGCIQVKQYFKKCNLKMVQWFLTAPAEVQGWVGTEDKNLLQQQCAYTFWNLKWVFNMQGARKAALLKHDTQYGPGSCFPFYFYDLTILYPNETSNLKDVLSNSLGWALGTLTRNQSILELCFKTSIYMHIGVRV